MARTRQQILDYLGTGKDEASLTDQELQDRLGAFQELSQNKETQRVYDSNGVITRIANDIKPRINGLGASDLGVQQAAEYAANTLRDQGSFDPQRFAEIIQAKSSGLSSQAFEDLKGRAAQYLPSAQQFYSSFFKDQPYGDNPAVDIKRIQDAVSGRQLKASNEKGLTDYLAALPDQLKGSREQFLSGETQRGIDQYNEQYVPSALQSANSRGALFSGDVPDLLTTGAIDVQGQLDQARQSLEQQDSQFYFNAAYQNKLRQVLESNTNFQDYLNNERQNVLTTQQQQFTSAQADLSRNFQYQMQQRQNELNLSAQNAQLKRQQQLAQQQSNSALAGTLGSTVGAIGGAVVGGPAGSVVGQNAGQVTGQQIGNSIG